MIQFNMPAYTGKETEYIRQAVASNTISGDGIFTKKCSAWLEKETGAAKALLTTSCTHALEMAALLCDIQPGDEVIMPSYTFVSTADAFVQRGAKIVFVDIRPDTLNIDEKLIEPAITDKTKAIAVVHYAGVACEMNAIRDIARRHQLKLVEDAAQAICSSYYGHPLGTLSDYGCLSFHETKNFTMGEGGALLISDPASIERAEIFREKGTNRSKYYRGQIDKYTWVDYGSSYLPSDMNAAYLWAQLEQAEDIQGRRLRIWHRYNEELKPLEKAGLVRLPIIPEGCTCNGHLFYMLTDSLETRTALIQHLKENGIQAAFHYVPLHSATAGKRFGRFCGEDRFTTALSERLVRLPIHYNLTRDEQTQVLNAVNTFYGK